MAQFIETIRLNNNIVELKELHIKRIATTLLQQKAKPAHLDWVKIVAENPYPNNIVKLRIVYSNKGVEDISYAIYEPKAIKSLKIVIDNNIDYGFKSTDRKRLNELYSSREGADDIIIIKDGKVADSSFANIVFISDNSIVTPSTYLLNGVQRQHLLSKGIITETEITEDSIKHYNSVKLINAMLPLDIAPEISVSEIF